MLDIAFSRPNGKGFDDLHLDHTRAGLIKTRGNGHDPAPRRLQREVDADLAAEARCSVGQVRAARRLVRSGSEDLTVAALLQLMPISTALRGAASPRRTNARYARWRCLVEICR